MVGFNMCKKCSNGCCNTKCLDTLKQFLKDTFGLDVEGNTYDEIVDYVKDVFRIDE